MYLDFLIFGRKAKMIDVVDSSFLVVTIPEYEDFFSLNAYLCSPITLCHVCVMKKK